MKLGYQLFIATSAMLISPMALAHDHDASSGFIAGLMHPVTGIDHLIALMLAGLFIGRRGSARWIAISGLMLALGSGTGGALLLGTQAWMEAAIVVSVPLFLALQWIRQDGRVRIALATMCLFMGAHGWAHGHEPAAMNLGFMFGWLVMSATVMCVLSVIGIAVESKLTALSDA
jgi:urease accessory protein